MIMMSNVLLALMCSGLLNGVLSDTSVKEGPCPSVVPASNFNVNQISGRWFLTHMTFDNPVGAFPKLPACVEEQFDLLDDGSFIINSTFKRDGDSLLKKYVPDGDVSGKYVTYDRLADGSWATKVFHHSTFIAFEGDYFLDFVCRELGNNKHREFHRIRSRTTSVQQEILDKFLGIIRASGDEKALYAYDQENCNYDQ